MAPLSADARCGHRRAVHAAAPRAPRSAGAARPARRPRVAARPAPAAPWATRHAYPGPGSAGSCEEGDAPQPPAARPLPVGSAAYFAAKSVLQSYDEDAEGCFEAAAARAARAARRATLRPAPGNLEGALAPWLAADADAAAARAAAAVKAAAGRVPPHRYAHLTAWLAARADGAAGAVEAAFEALQRERGLQALPPHPWARAYDEEAHGGELTGGAGGGAGALGSL
ncbi:hypothetical protein Rsub_11428 [Raphidocelis subcapitata]|uniref:Uncharacterized protein n=1 Tax=Raphidocelis subcapitata TaxID=307507 RepID=A0A2V0PHC7_9CHLO|nr:hypothetical protein Rsub_11428 [Raphidocelis subcapitata]|eukprot:GBF99221.1 hypothetical protein Rsub_11428 [Raphidocelis subcapitata]